MSTDHSSRIHLRPASRSLGLLGLASIATILVGALVTALPYSGYLAEKYSPLNHFISELGEVPTSRLAFVFNTGLLVGAIGLGFFLVILAGRVDGVFRPALMVAGLVSGAAGALLGVFPMNDHALHRPLSFAFFLTAWLVAAIFSAWLLRPRAGFSRALVMPGAIAVVTSIVFIFVYTSQYHPKDPSAPILGRSPVWAPAWLEWASLLTLFGWFACVSIALLRQPDSTEKADA